MSPHVHSTLYAPLLAKNSKCAYFAHLQLSFWHCLCFLLCHHCTPISTLIHFVFGYIFKNDAPHLLLHSSPKLDVFMALLLFFSACSFTCDTLPYLCWFFKAVPCRNRAALWVFPEPSELPCGLILHICFGHPLF